MTQVAPRAVELLGEIGFGGFQVWVIISIMGVMMADGAEVTVISALGNAVQKEYKITDMQKGLMISVVFAGAAVGGLFGGILGDACGRKPTLLVTAWLTVLTTVLSSFATGLVWPFIWRAAMGTSFGAAMVLAVVMVTEWSPPTHRNRMLVVGQIGFSVGKLYACGILWWIMPELKEEYTGDWRNIMLWTAAPIIVLFPIMYSKLYETPIFLLSKGREEEALENLKICAKANKRGEEEVDFATDFVESRSSTDPVLPPSEDENPEVHFNAWQKIKEALSMEYLCIVLSGAYLCFVANFLFYGVSYLLPQVLSTLNLHNAVAVLFFILCFEILGDFISYYMGENKDWSYRGCIMVLLACCSFSVLLMTLLTHGSLDAIALIGSCACTAFAAAYFCTLYVFLAEIFPSSIRGTAFSMCVSGGRLGSIIAPIAFEAMRGLDPFRFAAPDKRGDAVYVFLLVIYFLVVVGIMLTYNMPYELKCEPLHVFTGKSSREFRKRKKLQYGAVDQGVLLDISQQNQPRSDSSESSEDHRGAQIVKRLLGNSGHNVQNL
eukprot:GEMP01013550.1.p1 GENE.GEMP01013550.1~~GEMP01013550.1.p1  ORF type:complete len:549 (+),score=53.23 GEMP01013550.1:624-2270(+)